MAGKKGTTFTRTPKKQVEEAYQMLLNFTWPDEQIMKLTGVSRSTMSRLNERRAKEMCAKVESPQPSPIERVSKTQIAIQKDSINIEEAHEEIFQILEMFKKMGIVQIELSLSIANAPAAVVSSVRE